MPRKIILEIDCHTKFCGLCKKNKYAKLDLSRYGYLCDLFKVELIATDNSNRYFFRCDECLEAERLAEDDLR